MNIIFSPVVTDGMTVCLKHLIVEHHQLFKQLYPHRKLIPKHNFMTHYPRSIRKIGPILHVWTMRYEAKHWFFKNTIKNFKNITKSLAKKHQMAIAFHWESTPFESIDCGPVKTVKLNAIENGEIVAEELQVDLDCEVDVTSWITCFGTEYRPGLLVCSNIEDLPVFSLFFHSFNVRRGNDKNISVLKVDELCLFKPFDLQTTYGFDRDDQYVVPVHVLL